MFNRSRFNRRHFIKLAAAGAAAPLVAGVFDPRVVFAGPIADDAQSRRRKMIHKVADCTATIEAVALYGVQVNAERRFSWGVVPSRQHIFVGFQAGEHTGWSELYFGYRKHFENIDKDPRWDRTDWYQSLVGKTVGEALAVVEKSRAKQACSSLESAEICLVDLAGRLLGKPALELLELDSQATVPGVYCILTDDPLAVRKEAERALSQNLRSHLKLKLYGSLETDLPLVKAAREVMGKSAYIIGDVNNGYRRKKNDKSIEPLVEVMHSLHKTGLSACEDPANMSDKQWTELQARSGVLDLVPDAPVRHAWRNVDSVDREMGRVYNMHPSGMGAVFETVALGAAIRSWGKRLMVGDASLVGPACAAWTQLAIGMHADWVEAIEKPQENTVLADCLLETPIGRSDDGQFKIAKPLPGFGLDLDTEKLKAESYGVRTLS